MNFFKNFQKNAKNKFYKNINQKNYLENNFLKLLLLKLLKFKVQNHKKLKQLILMLVHILLEVVEAIIFFIKILI